MKISKRIAVLGITLTLLASAPPAFALSDHDILCDTPPSSFNLWFWQKIFC